MELADRNLTHDTNFHGLLLPQTNQRQPVTDRCERPPLSLQHVGLLVEVLQELLVWLSKRKGSYVCYDLFQSHLLTAAL
jgi:hypothetical protein